MAYDATKPLDSGYLAEAPAELREQFRALKEDQLVNAGALMGYSVGNASGNIPLNNGTLNTNLNADMLDGHDSAYFAAATHTHSAATENANGFMSNTDKVKLNSIASNAEVNQNAFSNVKVGSSTIQADGKTDTLELAAGTGITLTADTTNDKVTIDALAKLDVTSKYDASNIFANPPMTANPAYGMTYNSLQSNANDSTAPLGAQSATWYNVLTFADSPNRAMQIAGQAFYAQNLFFRMRHKDNSDFSQWQQWWRLAKSNATGAVGSSTKPVYLSDVGTVTECGTSLAVDITGNAASATSATNATKWDGYSIGSLPDTYFGSIGSGEGGQIYLNRGSSGGLINLDCYYGNFRVFGSGNDGSGTHVCLFDMDNNTINFRSTANAPIPTNSDAVGQWKSFGTIGNAFQVTSGGTWAYVAIFDHDGSVTTVMASVVAGGTIVSSDDSYHNHVRGFFYRIA